MSGDACSVFTHLAMFLDSEVVEAVRRWIDRNSDLRELELFLALIEESSPQEGPWLVTSEYVSTARRLPSEPLIRRLLDLAKATNRAAERKRLFQIAAYAARNGTNWPKWQEPIVSLLEQKRGFKGFIKSLLSDPNARWEKKEAKRKAKQDRETERSRNGNVAQLTPKLAGIASGAADQFGVLRWAADHYRNGRIRKDEASLEKIVKYTNEQIAAAIAGGLVHFAINTDIKVGGDLWPDRA